MFTSSASDRAIDITLESCEPVLSEAAKMTLIVPKRGLKEAFPWAPNCDWSCCLLGWYRNCYNLFSLTSCSRWFHRVLQSSVVCPCSWWYWQWRLRSRLKGSLLILLGHLKYGSFLIFSKTWCTSSQNTMLTTWGAVDPDYPVKSLRGLLLLYRSDLKSLLFLEITLPFPLSYCWSSSTLLYLSILSMS